MVASVHLGQAMEWTVRRSETTFCFRRRHSVHVLGSLMSWARVNLVCIDGACEADGPTRC